MKNKVRRYRAPHLLLHDYQYSVLYEAGYKYSSSKLWRRAPLSNEFDNGVLTEFPISYEDWVHIHYKENLEKLCDTFEGMMKSKYVHLYHPTFFASKKYASAWERLFKDSSVPRSIPLNEVDSKDDSDQEQYMSITIDLGLGRW